MSAAKGTRYIDRAERELAAIRNRPVIEVRPGVVAGLTDKHFVTAAEIAVHSAAAERLVTQFGVGVVLKVIDDEGLYWGTWRLGRNWCHEAVAVTEVGH